MKNKMMSLMFVFAMLMQLTVPVLAAGPTNSVSEYTRSTEIIGIKMNAEGEYALEVPSNTRSGEYDYLPVGRLNVSAADSKAIDVINQSKLSQDTKEGVLNKIRQAQENGEDELVVSVFSPDLRGITDERTDTIYHTYQGYEMKSDIVYVTGASTGWVTIASGVNAQNVAADIANTILSVAGFTGSTAVTLLSSGAAVLSLFSNFSSTIVTGTRDDYFQMRLSYNSQTQYTYAKVGTSWYLGLVSSAVQVTRVGTEQYYKNYRGSTANPCLNDRYVNYIHKSPNYDSPWAKAYQYYLLPEEELVRWSTGNVTFLF